MSKNTKVKIYFKADKDRHVTVELESRKDIEKLSVLVESEIFRAKYLADLDYSDNSGLVFKVDGEKIPAKTLLDSLNSYLEGGNSSASVKDSGEEDEPKKKKHKKDKKKKKKKHKKSHKFISFVTSEKDNDPESDENIVLIHRI